MTFETPFGYAGIIYREKPFSLLRIFLPKADLKALQGHMEKKAAGKTGVGNQKSFIAWVKLTKNSYRPTFKICAHFIRDSSGRLWTESWIT